MAQRLGIAAALLGDPPILIFDPRERDVLALMAEGRSNAGIAAALVLTLRSVRWTLLFALAGMIGIGIAAGSIRETRKAT